MPATISQVERESRESRESHESRESGTETPGASALFAAGKQSLQEYIGYVDGLEQRELGSKPPMIGFPMNLKGLQELEPLRSILARHAVQNNCGDPFAESKRRPYSFNTLESERVLLEKLMGDWGGQPDNTWGYVTTGGTEGVLRGLQAGLVHMNDPLNGKQPKKIMVIYCDQAHYCVSKACNLVLGQYAGHRGLVAHLEPNALGEIDLAKLRELVQTSRKTLDVDAFVLMATLGTTFLGACDDLEGIWEVFLQENVPKDDVWIHVDAALNGGWWNLKGANTAKYSIQNHFHSISVSGHKWWGGFIAGYIFVRRDKRSEEAVESQQVAVKYVKLVDKMIAGSRAGDAAILWTARLVQYDWERELEQCFDTAAFLVQELHKLGVACARTNLNVAFPTPTSELIDWFQLMNVDENCQIVVLPHVTKDIVRDFVRRFGEEVRAGVTLRSTCLLEAFNSGIHVFNKINK